MTEKNNLDIKDLNETLEFDIAKDLTIGEAVIKDSELKAGVTPDDSILDKYIKQNREQVTSQKFSQQFVESVETEVDSLDDFIQQERQGLTQAFPEVADELVVGVLADDQLRQDNEIDNAQATISLGLDDEKNSNRKKIFWLGAIFALLIGILGTAYAWLRNNQSSVGTSTLQTVQTTEAVTTVRETAETQKAVEAFDGLYKSFFVDDDQAKLKNSEFTKLSELETALKKLEGTASYDDAKSKFDRLSKSIEAIEAVNGKFETPTVVDGEKVTAQLKADASFDDLSSSALNTGNAALDTLLQAVVSESRAQLSGVTPTGSATSGQEVSTEGTSQTSLPQVEQTPAVTETVVATPAPVETLPAFSYGITNYDPNTLERGRSRVPYNWDVIADSSNLAWNFNPGVLERIVTISRQRGYITGDNYIIEKVNIVNGNGYYNMFKPDGTYLFSINAKTGYFVGNAAGYSDSLDY